jgi:hypothetical protein
MSRETNEQLRDHTDIVCSPSETRNRESKCAHWALVIHPREGLTETHAPFGSPVGELYFVAVTDIAGQLLSGEILGLLNSHLFY